MAFSGPPAHVVKGSLGVKIFAWAFFIPFGAMFVLALPFAAHDHQPLGALVMMGSFAIGLLGFGWWLQRRENRRICFYLDGAEQVAAGRTTSVAWADVSAIWLSASRPPVGKFGHMMDLADLVKGRSDWLEAGRTQVRVRIVAAGGELRMSSANRGCLAAFRYACERVQPRLLEAALVRARAGEVVEFGPLGVSRSGVVSGRGTLPLAEVASLYVDGGELCVATRERSVWARWPVGKVPSFLVACALFRTLSGHST